MGYSLPKSITVVFFLISNQIGKVRRKSVTCEAREPHSRACEASLLSPALCFQTPSRPFV